jgi:hypothetical protein
MSFARLHMGDEDGEEVERCRGGGKALIFMISLSF